MSLNLLTDAFPTDVTVGGKRYPLKTDFRVWLRFEAYFFDSSLSDAERFVRVCRECFDFEKQKELPESYNAVLKALMRFYSGGSSKSERGVGKTAGKASYDFTLDSGYIHAAFLETYGINLRNVPYMHWYEFLALFKGISKDCKFSVIVGYRTADISKMKGEEKKFYKEMKELYAIPDKRTREQKDKAMIDALSAAF